MGDGDLKQFVALVVEAYKTPHSSRRDVNRSNRSRELTQLQREFPKVWALAQSYGPDSVFSGIAKSRAPRKDLEKMVVYDTITSFGPDINASKVGRILPKIRRAAKRVGHPDLLAAYEQGVLEDIVDSSGMFGPASDDVRDPSDKYF